MASKTFFKIVHGPSDFNLILAYLRGPTNYSGGFRAIFTVTRADGSDERHIPLEVHGFERVPTAVDGHMIKVETKFGTSAMCPCFFCGETKPQSEHKCRLEGFFQTSASVGILWLSAFHLDNCFTVEPGTNRILYSDGNEFLDAITDDKVIPRIR